MGIQINGNTNNINAGIGSLSIEDINELDIVGVATAANFKTGVSNLHSVGLSLSGGQIDVGSNIKIGNAGVITASSYRGDGSQLTGITGTTINNNANNRVITGSGTANTLEGESNLTFDGSTFAITGGVTATALSTFSASGSALRLNDNSILRLGNDDSDFFLFHDAGSNGYISTGVGKVLRITTDDFRVFGANNTEQILRGQKDGPVELYHNNIKRLETFDNNPFVGISVTYDVVLNSSSDSAYRWAVGGNAVSNFKWSMYYSNSGSSLNIFDNVNSRNMASFKETGAIELNYAGTKMCETSANGLAFPSGKGIDFSADPSGTLKSLPNSFNAEVLHDYEVGTFVPNIQYDSGTGHYFGSVGSGQNVASAKGEYIRIGDLVSFAGEVTLTGNRNYTQAVHVAIGGMPYNGLHSTQQSSLMTGWGGAAWPKNDNNPSYRLIYSYHAYTTVSFQFKQTAGNNGIDGFRFWGFYRCAP